MRKVFLSIAVLFLSMLAWSGARAQTCTPTGFMRDSINLTAAMINPTGVFSGDVNATGCNIGIFYGAGATGTLNGASIHGANYFGVVRYGANVTITNSVVYQIGDQPFDGDQHGIAIYCADDSPQGSAGDIVNNLVYAYQKGGIVVNGQHCSGQIANNSVIGFGPVNFIAQNGIEAGDGSNVSISGNYIFGNSYTGPNQASSGGILVYGGTCFPGVTKYETRVQIVNNTAIGNDVGIYSINLDGNCTPTVTRTDNNIASNTLQNNAVNNVTGDGATTGYQAGILDQGDGDRIVGNQICGIGYAPVSSATQVTLPIDTTATNNAFVQGNSGCRFDVSGPQPRGHGPHRPFWDR